MPLPERQVLAILYPGEMGAALGRLLTAEGRVVVTTLQGRSARTRQRCERAGLEVLPSLQAVLERADLVLSVVPPAAAGAVVQSFARAACPGCKTVLYVDLNSTAPATKLLLAEEVRRAGAAFVDGVVHGLAERLAVSGKVYLSGPAAGQAAAALGPALPIQVLGPEVGRASALKMFLSGINKGLVALFTEMFLAARHLGLDEEVLARCREAYPGVLEVIERVLPTYPRHAARRADEMQEVEGTLRGAGVRPCFATCARELFADMARLNLAEADGAGQQAWTAAQVLEAWYAGGLGRASASDG